MEDRMEGLREFLQEAVGESAGVLENTISTFVDSLLYLNGPTRNITFKIAAVPPDGMVWHFEVLEGEDIKELYSVDDVETCLMQAEEYIGELLKCNPGYPDAAYLIGVGVEKALKQYQQPL